MWQIQRMPEMTLILSDVKIRQLAPAETGQCSGRKNTNCNCKTECKTVHAMKFSVLLHLPLTFMFIYSMSKAATDKVNQDMIIRAFCIFLKEGKSCPHANHKSIWENSTASLILKLGTKWRQVVSFILQQFHPWRKTVLPTE